MLQGVFFFQILSNIFQIQNLGLTQAKFSEQTLKHSYNGKGCVCVCLAFYRHLPLGKGGVKKLLTQNVNSLLSLYTRTQLY